MSTKTKPKPKIEPPPNPFIGWKSAPTDKEIASALGNMKPLWDQLIATLRSDEYEIRDSEWKCPAPKYGWSLRLKRAGRNILYLVPGQQSVRVASVLGKKAVAAAMAADIPNAMKKLIKESPVYPEGTGVRFEVKSAEDVAIAIKLAKLKLDN